MTARLAARSTVLALAGTAIAASLSDGFCLVRACTGIACPGCGMTRAAGRLLAGDVAGSLALHPLLIPTVVVGAIWAVEAWVVRGTERQPRLGPRLGIALAIAIPVVWAIRAVLGVLPPV